MELHELLNQKPLVVGDGAMGTALMAAGLPPGTAGELWNTENAEAVETIHRTYIEAGADCVLTNTFGANAISLGRHGLADHVEIVNRAGAEIARRAGRQDTLILGDIGPTGKLLEPFGDLTEEDARRAFSEQARVLSDAGVDGIIFETFESSEEMRIGLEAAREFADVPLIASMKFAREASGRYRTMMGEGPTNLIRVANECGCALVGANCGEGLRSMLPLAPELAAMADVPLIFQPNAGVPRLVQGKTLYDETPDVFAGLVPQLHEAGVGIIGGCCGTTADHIRAIRCFADSL
jgi:5-methyltetrahydrofolate--homocysteine methyltransferase